MRKGTNRDHQQKSLSHYGKFVKSVRLLNHSLQAKTEYCIKYVALYFIHPLFATCYVFIYSFCYYNYSWINIYCVSTYVVAVLALVFGNYKNENHKNLFNLRQSEVTFYCFKSAYIIISLLFATGETAVVFPLRRKSKQILIVEPRTLNTQTHTHTGKEYQLYWGDKWNKALRS